MCLYPRLLKNKKYEPNKKNGGNVPTVTDNRVLAVPIGCGRCMECMKKKSREWQVRLMEEIRENKNAHFVTLTLSNERYIELSKTTPEKGYEAIGFRVMTEQEFNVSEIKKRGVFERVMKLIKGDK